ncbi:myosin light chain kinase, smooth muscle-like [Amphiura filiformis]|uniref:myosin light chain kinase, smooth muscle-like n=1 Tax=Amphiura filiformis TaxID=82378 RepID=UPI003B212B40
MDTSGGGPGCKPVSLRKDEKFEDYYDTKEELGKGRFGKVYRCIEKATGKTWAAKFIKAIKQKDKEAVRSEISVMNQLNHDNLIKCFDAFEVRSQMIMVMEMIPGGELFERIISEDFEHSEADAITFMQQICGAVQHMHKNNVLHLDLKPENILCVEKSGHQIKLIDFGLARTFNGYEDVKVMFGTPEFVAPEVVNYEQIGFATDMWSVGVICYVLLSGLSPFMGDTAAETLNNVTAGYWDFEDEAFDNISEDAKNFIEQLLVKRKEKRITVQECLTHHWLQSKKDDLAANKLSKERLRKFVARRRWQKTANAVRAIGRMTALRLFSNLKKSGALTQIENNNTETSSPNSAISNNQDPKETNETLPNAETPSITTDIDLSSTSGEVSKAARAIQSAFRRNRPTTTRPDSTITSTTTTTTTKTVTFSEVVEEDIEPIDHQISTLSCDIGEYSLESDAMDIDLKDPETASDAATKIQAVYRGHRTRKVVLQPPEIIQSLRDCEVCEGSAAKFDCRIKGFPEPEISWYKDGEEIGDNRRYRVEFDEDDLCSLIVLDVEPDDDGRYTCEAKNCAGKVSCSAELLVEVLNAGDASTEEDELEPLDLISRASTLSSNHSRGSNVYESIPPPVPTSNRPSFPSSITLRPTIPSSSAPPPLPAKSSLRVHLNSNVNISRSESDEPTTSLPEVGGIHIRTRVGGENIEISRQKPAGNLNVSEFSPQRSTSRQVQGAFPAENRSTGTVYLNARQSNGITPPRKLTPSVVSEPDSRVYVKESLDTSRKTNTVSVPRSRTDIPRDKHRTGKVQDLVAGLKHSTDSQRGAKTEVQDTEIRLKSRFDTSRSGTSRFQGTAAEPELKSKFDISRTKFQDTAAEPRQKSRFDTTTTGRSNFQDTRAEQSRFVSTKSKFQDTVTKPSQDTTTKPSQDTSTKPSLTKRVGDYKSPDIVDSRLKSITDSPTTARSKVQDALSKFKRKTSLDDTEKRKSSIDETDKRTKSTTMLRGQGIGALTAKFESSKEESKPDRSSPRRNPIITAKVSDRKELFNNNNGSTSGSSLKSSPARSVVDRYTSPGKSASLKSKFESKPIAEKQPQFIRKPKGETLSEGDSVKFSCKASGVPDPSVAWQFKGKTLKDEGRCEIYEEKEVHYLEICDLVLDDAGIYTCKLLNSAGRASATAELTVTGNTRKSSRTTKPTISQTAPVFEKKLEDCEVNEGDEARLTCRVSGLPSPGVTWLYEGKPLKECKRRRITQSDDGTCALVISNVVEDDDAVYTCTAKNRLGSVSCTAEIQIGKALDLHPKSSHSTSLHSVEKETKGQTTRGQIVFEINASPREETRKVEIEIPAKSVEKQRNFETPSKIEEFSRKYDTPKGEEKPRYSEKSRSEEKPHNNGTPSKIEQFSRKFETPRNEEKSRHEMPNKIEDVSRKFETVSKRDTLTTELSKTEASSVRSSPFRTSERRSETIERTREKFINNNDIKNGNMTNRHEPSTISRTKSPPPTTSTPPKSPPPVSQPQADSTPTKKLQPKTSLSHRPVPKAPKPPEFLVRLRSQTVTEPRSAKFTCLVKGTPSPTVTWTKDDGGEPIHDDGRLKLSEDKGEHTLEIIETNTLDSGRYTCTLVNDAGKTSASATLTVNAQYSRDVAPKFLQNLEDIKVKDGEAAKFSCKITASPKPTVQWLYKGKEISADDDIFDTTFDGSLATLSLSDVLPEDEGEYTCSVRNSKGSCACSARLIVQVDTVSPPPSTLSPSLKSDTPLSSEPETLPDDETRLPVQTADEPEPVVEEPVNTTTTESEFCQCPSTTTVFTFPDETDSKEPKVEKKEDVAKGEGIPEFVTKLEDMEVVDGSPVVLSVKIKGEPLPDVMWIFDECEILEDDDFKLLQDGNTFSLVIREVYPEDAGEYTCRLIGDNDVEVECAAQLIVKDPEGNPAKFVQKPRSINVVEGSCVKLSCKIEGDPEPTLTWYKDDKELQSGERFILGVSSIGGLHTLEIPAVLVTDAGNYTCTIKNDLGEESCTVAVRVQQLQEEQTDFRSLLKSRPRLQNIQSPPGNDRPQPKKPIQEAEPEQLDFRHVLTRHVQTKKKPRFLTELEITCVKEGDEAVFECHVEGVPEPNIAWAMNGKPIKESKYFQMNYDGKIARLTITEAFPEDDGEYKCMASNTAGQSISVSDLRVTPFDGVDEHETQYNTNNSNSASIRVNGNIHIVMNNTSDLAKSFDAVDVNKSSDIVVAPGIDKSFEVSDKSFDEADAPGNDNENTTHATVDNDNTKYDSTDNDHDDDIENSDIENPPHEQKELPPPVPKKPSTSQSSLSEEDIEPPAEAQQTILTEASPTLSLNGGLLVATPPMFDEELQDEPITEGSAARMQCRVLGDPEPDIYWYKDGKELREGRKYRFEFEDDDVVALLINNASMSDLGIYTCRAVNRAGEAESSAQLIVEELLQPKVEGGPTNLQVVAGQTLNICCKISGRPAPDVIWYKDRKELRDDDRVHIDNSETAASLLITNAEEQDAGRYNLCLESDIGRDSFAISVSVVDKPEPPTGKPMASNISRDTLTLSWSGAAYDGGSRITGYIVEMCKTTDHKWNRVVRTSSTSYVLRNLEPEIEYLFRVSAENAHGISEPSEVSDMTLAADDAGGDDVFSGDEKHQDSEGETSSNSKLDTSFPAAAKVDHPDELKTDLMSQGAEIKQDILPPEQTQNDNSNKDVSSDVEINEIKHDIESSVDRAGSEDVAPCNADDGSNDEAVVEVDDASPSQLWSRSDEAEEEVITHNVTIRTDKEMSEFYELKEQIGKGRFGVVYRCKSKADGKELAAKFIKTTPKEMQAVREEIAVMNDLHHSKLLQCVDAFETPRQMILILEMIAGGELFERVIDDDFVLTERDVIKYMRQICAGVQHMHRQSILHLDLKPENIMCVDKTGSRIKLIDFGLARKFDPTANVKVMFGTPEFVAPEVINYEKINFATDMWSVGVICYILLSGLSPFMGDNDAETLSNVTLAEWDFEDEAFDDISDDAKDFIDKLLIKDLEKRKTVDDCLQDKWLIKDVNKMKACKISKDNFKKFVARRRWQKTATAVRALGRMASLTMFSGLKKNNGDSQDKTPFSALLRSKKEENAKKAKFLKEALTATSPRSPPPATSSRPNFPDRGATSEVANRARTRSHEKLNGDASPGSPREVSAPAFIKKMVDCEVFEGDHARFDCKITGEPEPEITWLQDGIKVEESHRFVFDYDDDGMCSLIIKNAIEDDDAEYTFKASNSAGEISCTADLIVDLL